MKQILKATTAAIAGLGALALLAGPSIAAGDHGAGKTAAPAQQAHMDQSRGGGWRDQPCPMGKTAPAMGGQGMMGHGMGGQGMMGQGMMGPGMHPQAKMGHGYGYGGGPFLGGHVVARADLGVDDARHFLDHRLAWHGNKRLKVGEIKVVDDDKITAEITTVDGSLVQRLEIDRHSGAIRHVE